MSEIGKIFKGIAKIFPLGAIGIATNLISGKKKSAVQASGIPTRSAALEAGLNDDELRRRRGFADNVLTGSGGAEAVSPATKVLLGR